MYYVCDTVRYLWRILLTGHILGSMTPNARVLRDFSEISEMNLRTNIQMDKRTDLRTKIRNSRAPVGGKTYWKLISSVGIFWCKLMMFPWEGCVIKRQLNDNLGGQRFSSSLQLLGNFPFTSIFTSIINLLLLFSMCIYDLRLAVSQQSDFNFHWTIKNV